MSVLTPVMELPAQSARNLKRRQVLIGGLEDPLTWPTVDVLLLPKGERARYNRLVHGITKYLSDEHVDVAIAIAKVSARRFHRILGRCLQKHIDGRIWGFRALPKGTHVKAYTRTAELKFGKDQTAGFSGLFTKCLRDHPQIEEGMTDWLLRKNKHLIRINKSSLRSLVAQFRAECTAAGIKDHEYPLNTEQKSRHALFRWYETVFMPQHSLRMAGVELGDDAQHLQEYGAYDHEPKPVASIYGTLQIDAVRVDSFNTYEVPGPLGDWEVIKLPRTWILRAIEPTTGTNFGWLHVLRMAVGKDDVLQLLWRCFAGTPRRTFTVPGMKYDEGAGFPQSEIELLRWFVFSKVLLDNALAHLANDVRHFITEIAGGTVDLGTPATPHERANIESSFARLAEQVFHQLPHSAGSGHKDPVRKTSARHADVFVRTVELEDVVEAYLANENAHAAAASGSIAPLVRTRQLLAADRIELQYLPVDRRRPHFFSMPVKVVVRHDPVGGRMPFINFLGERYTSQFLQQSVVLLGKPLIARPDFQDLRVLLLFHPDGREFGPVVCAGRWGLIPHDLRIRRFWKQGKKKKWFGPRADDNPLKAMIEHLRDPANARSGARHLLAHLLNLIVRHGDDVSAMYALDEPVENLESIVSNAQGDDAPAKVVPSPSPTSEKAGGEVAVSTISTSGGPASEEPHKGQDSGETKRPSLKGPLKPPPAATQPPTHVPSLVEQLLMGECQSVGPFTAPRHGLLR